MALSEGEARNYVIRAELRWAKFIGTEGNPKEMIESFQKLSAQILKTESQLNELTVGEHQKLQKLFDDSQVMFKRMHKEQQLFTKPYYMKVGAHPTTGRTPRREPTVSQKWMRNYRERVELEERASEEAGEAKEAVDAEADAMEDSSARMGEYSRQAAERNSILGDSIKITQGTTDTFAGLEKQLTFLANKAAPLTEKLGELYKIVGLGEEETVKLANKNIGSAFDFSKPLAESTENVKNFRRLLNQVLKEIRLQTGEARGDLGTPIQERVLRGMPPLRRVATERREKIGNRWIPVGEQLETEQITGKIVRELEGQAGALRTEFEPKIKAVDLGRAVKGYVDNYMSFAKDVQNKYGVDARTARAMFGSYRRAIDVVERTPFEELYEMINYLQDEFPKEQRTDINKYMRQGVVPGGRELSPAERYIKYRITPMQIVAQSFEDTFRKELQEQGKTPDEIEKAVEKFKTTRDIKVRFRNYLDKMQQLADEHGTSLLDEFWNQYYELKAMPFVERSRAFLTRAAATKKLPAQIQSLVKSVEPLRATPVMSFVPRTKKLTPMEAWKRETQNYIPWKPKGEQYEPKTVQTQLTFLPELKEKYGRVDKKVNEAVNQFVKKNFPNQKLYDPAIIQRAVEKFVSTNFPIEEARVEKEDTEWADKVLQLTQPEQIRKALEGVTEGQRLQYEKLRVKAIEAKRTQELLPKNLIAGPGYKDLMSEPIIEHNDLVTWRESLVKQASKGLFPPQLEMTPEEEMQGEMENMLFEMFGEVEDELKGYKVPSKALLDIPLKAEGWIKFWEEFDKSLYEIPELPTFGNLPNAKDMSEQQVQAFDKMVIDRIDPKLVNPIRDAGTKFQEKFIRKTIEPITQLQPGERLAPNLTLAKTLGTLGTAFAPVERYTAQTPEEGREALIGKRKAVRLGQMEQYTQVAKSKGTKAALEYINNVWQQMRGKGEQLDLDELPEFKQFENRFALKTYGEQPEEEQFLQEVWNVISKPFTKEFAKQGIGEMPNVVIDKNIAGTFGRKALGNYSRKYKQINMGQDLVQSESYMKVAQTLAHEMVHFLDDVTGQGLPTKTPGMFILNELITEAKKTKLTGLPFRAQRFETGKYAEVIQKIPQLQKALFYYKQTLPQAVPTGTEAMGNVDKFLQKYNLNRIIKAGRQPTWEEDVKRNQEAIEKGGRQCATCGMYFMPRTADEDLCPHCGWFASRYQTNPDMDFDTEPIKKFNPKDLMDFVSKLHKIIPKKTHPPGTTAELGGTYAVDYGKIYREAMDYSIKLKQAGIIGEEYVRLTDAYLANLAKTFEAQQQKTEPVVEQAQEVADTVKKYKVVGAAKPKGTTRGTKGIPMTEWTGEPVKGTGTLIPPSKAKVEAAKKKKKVVEPKETAEASKMKDSMFSAYQYANELLGAWTHGSAALKDWVRQLGVSEDVVQQISQISQEIPEPLLKAVPLDKLAQFKKIYSAVVQIGTQAALSELGYGARKPMQKIAGETPRETFFKAMAQFKIPKKTAEDFWNRGVKVLGNTEDTIAEIEREVQKSVVTKKLLGATIGGEAPWTEAQAVAAGYTPTKPSTMKDAMEETMALLAESQRSLIKEATATKAKEYVAEGLPEPEAGKKATADFAKDWSQMWQSAFVGPKYKGMDITAQKAFIKPVDLYRILFPPGVSKEVSKGSTEVFGAMMREWESIPQGIGFRGFTGPSKQATAFSQFIEAGLPKSIAKMLTRITYWPKTQAVTKEKQPHAVLPKYELPADIKLVEKAAKSMEDILDINTDLKDNPLLAGPQERENMDKYGKTIQSIAEELKAQVDMQNRATEAVQAYMQSVGNKEFISSIGVKRKEFRAIAEKGLIRGMREEEETRKEKESEEAFKKALGVPFKRGIGAKAAQWAGLPVPGKKKEATAFDRSLKMLREEVTLRDQVGAAFEEQIKSSEDFRTGKITEAQAHMKAGKMAKNYMNELKKQEGWMKRIGAGITDFAGKMGFFGWTTMYTGQIATRMLGQVWDALNGVMQTGANWEKNLEDLVVTQAMMQITGQGTVDTYDALSEAIQNNLRYGMSIQAAYMQVQSMFTMIQGVIAERLIPTFVAMADAMAKIIQTEQFQKLLDELTVVVENDVVPALISMFTSIIANAPAFLTLAKIVVSLLVTLAQLAPLLTALGLTAFTLSNMLKIAGLAMQFFGISARTAAASALLLTGVISIGLGVMMARTSELDAVWKKTWDNIIKTSRNRQIARRLAANMASGVKMTQAQVAGMTKFINDQLKGLIDVDIDKLMGETDLKSSLRVIKNSSGSIIGYYDTITKEIYDSSMNYIGAISDASGTVTDEAGNIVGKFDEMSGKWTSFTNKIQSGMTFEFNDQEWQDFKTKFPKEYDALQSGLTPFSLEVADIDLSSWKGEFDEISKAVEGATKSMGDFNNILIIMGALEVGLSVASILAKFGLLGSTIGSIFGGAMGTAAAGGLAAKLSLALTGATGATITEMIMGLGAKIGPLLTPIAIPVTVAVSLLWLASQIQPVGGGTKPEFERMVPEYAQKSKSWEELSTALQEQGATYSDLQIAASNYFGFMHMNDEQLKASAGYLKLNTESMDQYIERMNKLQATQGGLASAYETLVTQNQKFYEAYQKGLQTPGAAGTITKEEYDTAMAYQQNLMQQLLLGKITTVPGAPQAVVESTQKPVDYSKLQGYSMTGEPAGEAIARGIANFGLDLFGFFANMFGMKIPDINIPQTSGIPKELYNQTIETPQVNINTPNPPTVTPPTTTYTPPANYAYGTGWKIPPMQHGGIVTKATNVLAGEAGPEAIIPLKQLEAGTAVASLTASLNALTGMIDRLTSTYATQPAPVQAQGTGTQNVTVYCNIDIGNVSSDIDLDELANKIDKGIANALSKKYKP